jgi:hypothetical protein
MKKIELEGLGGLHIEIYDTKDKYTNMEMMKEAEKAIRRKVMFIEGEGKNEPRPNIGFNR